VEKRGNRSSCRCGGKDPMMDWRKDGPESQRRNGKNDQYRGELSHNPFHSLDANGMGFIISVASPLFF